MSFSKPKKFDYNLIVIGAGAAGLVSSLIASTLKAKVALIEKHKMGGDCLNTGCVPSKALIRTAKIAALIKKHKDYGIRSANLELDFSEVMERIQKVITAIEPHDSIERYTGLGVECIQGSAHIRSPWQVEVNGKTLTTRAIIISTGARPLIPDIPGISDIPYYTSDTIWDLRTRPSDLLIFGGGPIGCELAQAFQRLGIATTLVEQNPHSVLGREDKEVGETLTQKLREEGLEVLLGTQLIEFKKSETTPLAILKTGDKIIQRPFSACLFAMGRTPNVSGFGIEELGIQLRGNTTIEANDFLATNYSNIYVCGDVTGPYQFTHMAAHQAYYASVNALFGIPLKWLPNFVRKKFLKVDYSVVPWATYTDPEVATVGLTEKSAKANHTPYELTTYGIDDLDRAIADGEDHGFIKVLTVPGSDKILGATIVHSRASELIAEFILAMKLKAGLSQILGTIHIYPTLSEANKYLAGNWKKARKPEKLLNILEKFFNWMRA